ncbi:cuticle collagen 40-like [Apus apus]|uniref:cuticle collagen 40-like n=1 Tax=Apus apus TaxID=8895 RepID=UPI0021F8302D|nr:cuticle collagen 40-like [Apus apus]
MAAPAGGAQALCAAGEGGPAERKTTVSGVHCAAPRLPARLAAPVRAGKCSPSGGAKGAAGGAGAAASEQPSGCAPGAAPPGPSRQCGWAAASRQPPQGRAGQGGVLRGQQDAEAGCPAQPGLTLGRRGSSAGLRREACAGLPAPRPAPACPPRWLPGSRRAGTAPRQTRALRLLMAGNVSTRLSSCTVSCCPDLKLCAHAMQLPEVLRGALRMKPKVI